MAQNNDCKFDALRAQGYTGAIDDMERAWGIDNGLPEGTTGTPWYNALIAGGITPMCINDMEAEFWCNQGGSFSLKAITGYTDGNNCDGSNTYTVNFNSPVNFVDQTDVNFVKNQGEVDVETILAITGTGSPNQQIIYSTPVWAVPLAQGDTVDLVIGALSNYQDGDAVPIEAQTLRLTNCLDVVTSDNMDWSAGDNLEWATNDNAEWTL